MFKVQFKYADGDWQDDPRTFETEDQAQRQSDRIVSIASVETRIVEVE